MKGNSILKGFELNYVVYTGRLPCVSDTAADFANGCEQVLVIIERMNLFRTMMKLPNLSQGNDF